MISHLRSSDALQSARLISSGCRLRILRFVAASRKRFPQKVNYLLHAFILSDACSLLASHSILYVLAWSLLLHDLIVCLLCALLLLPADDVASFDWNVQGLHFSDQYNFAIHDSGLECARTLARSLHL